MLTFDVYLSDDIYIEYINDFYSIKAKKDLPIGHLINIEHILCGDNINFLLNGTASDNDLFNSLYPRNIDITFEELIIKKTKSNMFIFNIGDNILGKTISKFNHSCNNNSHLIYQSNLNNSKFYGAYTIKKVKKDEELTFNYINKSDNDFHNKMKIIHNFTCVCDKKAIDRFEKRSKKYRNIAQSFKMQHENFINNTIGEYMSTDVCKNICINHYELYKKLNNKNIEHKYI
jgi:hypothetical protein